MGGGGGGEEGLVKLKTGSNCTRPQFRTLIEQVDPLRVVFFF